MKKLLVIAILMLALVFTVVACDKTPDATDTTAEDTTVETPTETPVEDATEAPSEEEPTAEETTEAPTEEITTEAPTEKPTEAPTTAKPEAPTEPATEDPSEPVWIIEPDAIHTLTQSTETTVAQQIVSSEIMTEGNTTFVRLIANGMDDPYVAIIPLGSNELLPNYMAVKYRTNSAKNGQFFMGSGQGWTGQGDSFNVDWNENAEWNLMVIDLTATGMTSINNNVITYARFDFFAGVSAEGDYIDVEYVAFFNTAEYANAYDFAKHPPYVEADDPSTGKIAHSFDTFYVNDVMYFPEDGGAGDKLTAQNNTITFEIGEVHKSLALRGWIGFSQPIVEFGYFVDNYKMVYGEYRQDTEAGVLAAGGENATRFQINVPLASLTAGEHKVGFVVKLEDGTVVRLREDLTVIIPESTNIPETTVNTTVKVTDCFTADSAADAKIDIKQTALTDLFTTITYGAGVAQYAENGDAPQFKVGSFTEIFRKMDGTYAYTIHNIGSAKKQMASFFVRGAQSVKPLDTTGITNVLNNYYETDGQSSGHAGAGIQVWPHSKILLAVKYYDENALTRIGTKYWLINIDSKDGDVSFIDNGSMVYITVNGVLAASVELVGEGKSYDDLYVSGNATFCEKAIVRIYHEVTDYYGTEPTADETYVIENTLIVDTPMSDLGIATRNGTLKFSELSVAPLSTVEIPKAPSNVPTFEGNAAHFSVCADNVRTWVDGSYTDLCTQEAHKYMAEVNGQVNVDGLEAVSFRGWANPTVGGIEIVEFGYQIGMNEPVFSADFWQEEPELNAALGSAAAKRYESIKIPVSELAAGTYNVYLLIKDTNGVIYCMNATWGSITLVKTAA